jgi:hypothetical protein
MIATAGFSGQAVAQTQPSPESPSPTQTIHGHIIAVDGPFNIRIRDDAGYEDYVELHRGTIITPTGLTLTVEMDVKVLGYKNGTVFEANEIDAPYTYAGPPPL